MRHHNHDEDYGVVEAHRRFGGIDFPAAFAGMLAALGLTVLLAGIASAAGSYGYYERGTDTTDLTVGGVVAGFAVLLVSFLFGGWVAGRMARYDGMRNGILTAVLFVLLAAAIAGLGAWAGDEYDFFGQVNLPDWFTDIDRGSALASAIGGVIVMVLAAGLGGSLGAGYHRRADAVIVDAPEGEVVRSDDADAEFESTSTSRRRRAHR